MAGQAARYINIQQMERVAMELLPTPVRDYYAGGSGDEQTMAHCQQALRRLQLWPRVLRSVGRVDLRTTVLGKEQPLPIIVGPTALQRMAHPGGEAASMQAAHAHGIPFVLSSLATTALDDAALTRAPASGTRWFQVSLGLRREYLRYFVEWAEQHGYEALVFTVDSSAWGNRERDKRSLFAVPSPLRFENFERLQQAFPELQSSPTIKAVFSAASQGTVSGWDGVEWVRTITRLPVVLKGILHPEDAVEAARRGCDAIVVSNHGGRQLDDSVASIDALPRVVAALDRLAPELEGRVPEVLFDGGVRRGGDIAKALALGARAVLIGRPILWALCVGGQDGVERVLHILRAELEQTLKLCGIARSSDCRALSPLFPERWVSSKL